MIPTFQQGQFGRVASLTPGFGPPPLWDAATVSSPLQLQNTDTRLFLPTGNSGIAKTARCTKALTSGKWYWEVAVIDVIAGFGTTTGVGIAESGQSLSANLATGTSAKSVGWWCSGNGYANGALYTSAWQTFGDGDRLMVAIDIGAAMVWFGKNGTWSNAVSGNPAAGTGNSFTLVTPGTYYPAASPWSSSAETVKLDIKGGTDLLYAIPNGFTSYSS